MFVAPGRFLETFLPNLVLGTARKGGVLATKAVGTQGKGCVLATTAVEAQGKISILAAKAVERQGTVLPALLLRASVDDQPWLVPVEPRGKAVSLATKTMETQDRQWKRKAKAVSLAKRQ